MSDRGEAYRGRMGTPYWGRRPDVRQFIWDFKLEHGMNSFLEFRKQHPKLVAKLGENDRDLDETLLAKTRFGTIGHERRTRRQMAVNRRREAEGVVSFEEEWRFVYDRLYAGGPGATTDAVVKELMADDEFLRRPGESAYWQFVCQVRQGTVGWYPGWVAPRPVSYKLGIHWVTQVLEHWAQFAEEVRAISIAQAYELIWVKLHELNRAVLSPRDFDTAIREVIYRGTYAYDPGVVAARDRVIAASPRINPKARAKQGKELVKV